MRERDEMETEVASRKEGFKNKRNKGKTSNMHPFSGTFEQLRKTTISFGMSVRPSAWKNSTPTRQILTKLGIRNFFFNLWRKFILN